MIYCIYMYIVLKKVVKSRYQGGNKMKFLNKEPVLVEEHLNCKCECKKKESDCSRFQRYNKASCSCLCINTEDQTKCWRVCLSIQFFDLNHLNCFNFFFFYILGKK